MTVVSTSISLHGTFPLSVPSVTNTLPSGRVNCTTSGDFSPGAIAGPLGRLACMDAMAVLARETLIPSLTFIAAQPVRQSSEATANQIGKRVLISRGTEILEGM